MLLVVLLFSFSSFSQTPFDILRQAEEHYIEGNYKKALARIKKAKKMKYCTCGTCAIQLEIESSLLKSKVYIQMKEYALSRQILDSCYIQNDEVDELRVTSFQAEYGTEFIAKHIDTALINARIFANKDGYPAYVDLPIGKGYTPMRFKLSGIHYPLYLGLEKCKDQWIADFKESSAYHMTKNKAVPSDN